MRIALVSAAIATLSPLAGGCAGATIGSGVGDRVLDRPPYYAGGAVTAPACIGHLPVSYQRGASQAPAFDPAGGGGTPMAALLAELSAYLDSLGATTALAGAGPPSGTAPDVRFGCETDASGDCIRDEAHDVRNPRLHLSVGRPSGSWVSGMQAKLEAAGAERALVVTLEVGHYWTRQRNFRGDKEVRLGTGYAADVPWLTSLETPVSVLQLTGALVDRTGKALRIGVEGLLARRTSLLASGFGAQALITDEDVERLRTSRREDLPDRPLVWQAGLRNLVTGLTGGGRHACRPGP